MERTLDLAFDTVQRFDTIPNVRRPFRTRHWRRGRDSNPRYGFPHTHFPGVRLQPLGHPSVARARPGTRAEGDSTGRYAGASSLARARQREAMQINGNKRQ
jgi:hypothetical protein